MKPFSVQASEDTGFWDFDYHFFNHTTIVPVSKYINISIGYLKLNRVKKLSYRGRRLDFGAAESVLGEPPEYFDRLDECPSLGRLGIPESPGCQLNLVSALVGGVPNHDGG